MFVVAGALGSGGAFLQETPSDTTDRQGSDTLGDAVPDVFQERLDLGALELLTEDDVAASEGGSELLTAERERIDELASWKVDVNRATEEELESIPGISAEEAIRIVAYRKRHGRIDSLSDLEETGLSRSTIAAASPFLTIQRSRRLPVRAEIVQRWSRRWPRSAGYRQDTTRTRYLGDPNALMTRLRVALGRRVRLGLTLDKDAGEPLYSPFSSFDLGHDFAAGYLAIEDVGPIRRLVIGDFTVNTGEGLNLGQGSSMRMGTPTTRSRESLRPFTSSSEYGYFRGIAVHTKGIAGIRLTGFVSRRGRDARFDEAAGVWNFRETGLHRTETERGRRLLGTEVTAGWVLGFHGRRVRLGTAGSVTRRSVPGQSIDSASNYSVHVGWIGRAYALTTELATRDQGPPALSGTLVLHPMTDLEWWLTAVRAGAFGAAPHAALGVDGSGLGRREEIYSSGFRLRRPTWSVLLSSRWRSTADHPLEGPSRVTSGSLEMRLTPWLIFRLRGGHYRDEPLRSCSDGTRTIRCSAVSRRRSVRLQVDYVHSAALRHRFQIEVSDGATEAGPRRRGFAAYKDIRWRPARQLQVDGRLMFFEVADFSARIYSYENDLLYSFSAPVLSGRGRRGYVLMSLGPVDGVTLQLKYAFSSYEDVRSVGSGLDTVDGPVRRDIRVQIRWKIG